jgi:hypothetical protein
VPSESSLARLQNRRSCPYGSNGSLHVNRLTIGFHSPIL